MRRYAILDGSYRPGHATRLAADGVDYIQLRAKALSASELFDLARSILDDIAAVPGASTRLLINGRADVAKALSLASGTPVGVHLTSAPDELTPPQIRQLYATSPAPYSLLPAPCTSVSCHTLDLVRQAAKGGADLILFGPVFEKRVAQQFITDGSGLTLLAVAVEAAAGVPVLALGGVTAENIPDCLAAGAAGIAAIRLFA